MVEFNPVAIDWENEDSACFFNPRISQVWRERILAADFPPLPKHIWVASSGTTSAEEIKLVGLSKDALLNNARSVVQHLSITEKDVLARSLPRFHVGGLSVEARAFVADCSWVSTMKEKWQPQQLAEELKSLKVTICSLVPTQLYDLVQLKIKAPQNLRVALLGGASCSEELYCLGRELGWKLLPTYGMTELSSQVATSKLSQTSSGNLPRLWPLSHNTLRVTTPSAQTVPVAPGPVSVEGRLWIKSTSVCSGVLRLSLTSSGRYTPQESPWFKTSDLAVVENDGSLKLCGRVDDLVKVNGELVNTSLLQRKLSQLVAEKKVGGQWVILALEDPRRGQRLVVVTDSANFKMTPTIIVDFNSAVMPFEKLSEIYHIKEIPLKGIGKIDVNAIRKLIS